MRTRVKVCCIGSAGEARTAVAAGADALGLVSAMPSGPGVISEALIAAIAAQVPPPVATFLLTSRTDADGIVEQVRHCRTSVVQLVDRVESPVYEELRHALPGVRLVQVVHVGGGEALEEARAAASHVDAVLLDSGRPQAAVRELGGTGRVHDWDVSRRIVDALEVPVFLAGGLHAGNVADAIRQVRPFGVDVCSGVRTGGRLAAQRLQRFADAVASAVR